MFINGRDGAVCCKRLCPHHLKAHSGHKYSGRELEILRTTRVADLVGNDYGMFDFLDPYGYDEYDAEFDGLEVDEWDADEDYSDVDENQ